ncbi:HAD family hydrolase [Paenarthrobacter sp. NPDC056912]|uniref:HAD family hydrolase n=1 Tax=Paenarthrobacter sp. NPDC056912 TaxID=3345965 RepID=UPI003672013F
MPEDPLPSWREGSPKSAITRFVDAVATGPEAVPAPERIAVFDNDGTLWPEKPMPAQLHYIVEQWKAAAGRDPGLADVEPYRSILRNDFGWLQHAFALHAQGQDSELRTVVAAITKETSSVSVTEYAESVSRFMQTAKHPTLGRSYSRTVYQPMIELLRHLGASGFTCFVVSGSDRDFMRPIVQSCYGIPPERVIGSALGLNYDAGTAEVRYGSTFAFMDDGPEKPVRIWSRIGRRPLFAAGNSDGDAQMLDYTLGGSRGALALLVQHDDVGRDDEPYEAGAESVRAAAADRGITNVSIARDWARVFPL